MNRYKPASSSNLSSGFRLASKGIASLKPGVRCELPISNGCQTCSSLHLSYYATQSEVGDISAALHRTRSILEACGCGARKSFVLSECGASLLILYFVSAFHLTGEDDKTSLAPTDIKRHRITPNHCVDTRRGILPHRLSGTKPILHRLARRGVMGRSMAKERLLCTWALLSCRFSTSSRGLLLYCGKPK